MKHPKIQFEEITRLCRDLISKKELFEKLEQSFKTKTPLKIKAGFDPSYPDLHLGHLVLLQKLKLFQDLGHEVIFLIGDFTARIGDPSGQSEARPRLSSAQVQQNVQTYSQQVFKILDQKKTKIVYNSSWMKNFSPEKWIELLSLHTVARMLERDDFSKRFKNKKPIYIHEFLYPLIQGYDSVAVSADVEIGGTDQIFNLLMGRELQKHFQTSAQCVLTYPLLEGTSGKLKMSKSLDNFIAFEDSPKNIYGKVMSLSDSLMIHYFDLLAEDEEASLIEKDLKEGRKNPLEEKKKLARMMVQKLYGPLEAESAEKEFQKIFSDKSLPPNIPLTQTAPVENIWLCRFLKQLGMIPSTSEGRRLIESGGVKINSKKVSNPDMKITMNPSDTVIFQIGKRNFLKVKTVKQNKG